MPKRRAKPKKCRSPRTVEPVYEEIDPNELLDGFQGDPYYAQRATIYQSLHEKCRGVVIKPYYPKKVNDEKTKKKKQMNASKNATGYGGDMPTKKRRSKRHNTFTTDSEISELFREVGLSDVDLEKIEKERKRRAAALARIRKKKHEAKLADPSGSPVQRLNWIVKVMSPYTGISTPSANTTSQLAMRLLVDLCACKNHCGLLVKRNVLPFLIALTVCSHESIQVKSFLALQEYLTQLFRLPDWSRYLTDFMFSRLVSAIVEHMMDSFLTANAHPKSNRGRVAALLQDRDLYPCLPLCLNLLCMVISEMVVKENILKGRKRSLSEKQIFIYRKIFVKFGGLFVVVLFVHCGGRIGRNAFEPYMPYLDLGWIDKILDSDTDEFCLPESMRMTKQWNLIIQSMHEESSKRGERSFIEERKEEKEDVNKEKREVNLLQRRHDVKEKVKQESPKMEFEEEKLENLSEKQFSFENKTQTFEEENDPDIIEKSATIAMQFDVNEARRRAQKRIKARTKHSKTRRLLSKGDRRILQSLLRGTSIMDDDDERASKHPNDDDGRRYERPSKPLDKLLRKPQSKSKSKFSKQSYEAQLEQIYGDSKKAAYPRSSAILHKCIQVAKEEKPTKDVEKSIIVGGLSIG